MRTCEYCGVSFTPTSNAQKFCSPKCRQSRPTVYERTRYKYVQKPKATYSPGKVKCLSCNHTFKAWDVKLNRICNRCKGLASRDTSGVENSFLEVAIS